MLGRPAVAALEYSVAKNNRRKRGVLSMFPAWKKTTIWEDSYIAS